MKKYFHAFLILAAISAPMLASAQHQPTMEEGGAAVWAALRADKVKCEAVTDDQWEQMGTYFMSQMLGDAHHDMNLLVNMRLGPSSTRVIHIVMGKRMSECYPNQPFPSDLMARFILPMMSTYRNSSQLGQSMQVSVDMLSWNFGMLIMMLWSLLTSLFILVIILRDRRKLNSLIDQEKKR